MLTVTVAATAGTPSTPLYPGGTGDVTLRVTNPNAYAVTLVSRRRDRRDHYREQRLLAHRGHLYRPDRSEYPDRGERDHAG